MAYTWDETKSPVISEAEVGGVTYYLKDAEARAAIDTISSYTKFLGVTTTTITDETGAVVVIDGEDVTAKAGDIVINGSKEFIYNGTSWAEFGDLDAITDLLGDLAYNNTASASYTPVGDISVSGSFVGKESTISVSGSTAGTLTVTSSSVTGNYTPYGTIDPDIKTTNTDIVATYTSGTLPSFSATDATVLTGVSTAGTVPSFSATNATVLTGVSTAGTVPTFASTTTTVVASATQGTLPTFTASLLTASVSGEKLTFALSDNGFTQGTLPTFTTSDVVDTTTFTAGAMPTFASGTVVGSTTWDAGTSATVTTGSAIGSVTASNPTFSGTVANFEFTPASITLTGSYTPELSEVPTYSFVGSTSTITVTGSQSKPS